MRVDWHMIAGNIRSVGRGAMAQASRRCGMQDDWLCQFYRKRAFEPGFSVALKLLRAHLELCGKEKHREVIKK